MPKRGARKPSNPQVYELSDSSEDESYVTLERYQQAALQQGLQTKRNRVRAVKELSAIVDQIYRDAAKGVQLAIFEDMLAAARVVDRRPVYSEELSKLVRQAQRVLPQQKRNQLNKESKATQLAQKRSGKKAGSSGSSAANESDDDEEELVFGHLPLEVVGTIFSFLDPLALGAATCVSRAWMEISYDSGSWRTWLEAAVGQHMVRAPASSAAGRLREGPDAASTSQQRTMWHKSFCRFVTDRPTVLLPWQSDRVLVNGRLSWQGVPNRLDWLRLNSLPRAKLQRAGTGPLPLTIQRVLLWLKGRHPFMESGLCHTDSSSTDDSSGNDDDDDDAQDGLQRPFRLWNV